MIVDYDINDYKAKTELTTQKLFTTVIASLRTYESLLTIEMSRRGLGKILEGAANLYQYHSLQDFAPACWRRSVPSSMSAPTACCAPSNVTATTVCSATIDLRYRPVRRVDRRRADDRQSRTGAADAAGV